MKRVFFLSFAAAAVCLWAASVSVAQTGYSPVYLASNAFPTDINNRGQVVGYYAPFGNPPIGGFIWSQLTGLQNLGAFPDAALNNVRANAINDAGVVVGYAHSDDFSQQQAFVWNIASEPQLSAFPYSRALDINERGAILTNNAIWSGPGQITPLSFFEPTGLNRFKQTAWFAGGGFNFFGSPESDFYVDPPMGEEYAFTTGINDASQVIGYSTLGNDGPFNSSGFVWDEQEGYVSLTSDPDTWSVPAAINNDGTVVGIRGSRSAPFNPLPFIWDRSSGMRDLSFSDGSFQPSGINDRGQIVGYDGYSAVLLNPINLGPDSVPPKTRLILSGPAGGNGWYLGPVSARLRAYDRGGNGMGTTYFQRNGGVQTTYIEDQELSFTTSGVAGEQLAFWSVDSGGIAESMQTTTIRIDDTIPQGVSVAVPSSLKASKKVPQATVLVLGRLRDTISGLSPNVVYFVEDEYGLHAPSGLISVSSGGYFVAPVSLALKRNPGDADGRLYRIRVFCNDIAGNSRELVTEVRVR